MTFSNQEVPTWDVYDNDMYDDLQLPIQDGQHFLEQTEIKTEDPYSPYVCQPSTPLSQPMIGSPPVNMPAMCQSFNQIPYSPSHPSVIQSLASPSNVYLGSPNSNYSASPVDSPQHFQADEFLRYSLQARTNMYPTPMQHGYYYADYSGKRRKRDDELTPEEYEKRRLRRERNKQAALRCRTRRRERIDALEQETNDMEDENRKVESEIKGLRKQIEDLQQILKEHNCDKKIPIEIKYEDVVVKSEPA